MNMRIIVTCATSGSVAPAPINWLYPCSNGCGLELKILRNQRRQKDTLLKCIFGVSREQLFLGSLNVEDIAAAKSWRFVGNILHKAL